MLTLGQFFTEALRLVDQHGESVAPYLCGLLSPILRDPKTVEAIEPGIHLINQRKGGLAILSTSLKAKKWSQPHDHGRTWVIYGVCTSKTAMYDYKLVKPAEPQAAPGRGCAPREGKKKGQVVLSKRYWVMPGQCGFYPTGAIHSHYQYEDSKIIRIEGINMHPEHGGEVVGGRYYERVKEQE